MAKAARRAVLRRTGGGRGKGAEAGEDLVLEFSEDGDEEVALVLELVIEGAAGHTGFLDDALGGGAGIALGGEEAAGDIKKGAAGSGGLFGLGGHGWTG